MIHSMNLTKNIDFVTQASMDFLQTSLKNKFWGDSGVYSIPSRIPLNFPQMQKSEIVSIPFKFIEILPYIPIEHMLSIFQAKSIFPNRKNQKHTNWNFLLKQTKNVF